MKRIYNGEAIFKGKNCKLVLDGKEISPDTSLQNISIVVDYNENDNIVNPENYNYEVQYNSIAVALYRNIESVLQDWRI